MKIYKDLQYIVFFPFWLPAILYHFMRILIFHNTLLFQQELENPVNSTQPYYGVGYYLLATCHFFKTMSVRFIGLSTFCRLIYTLTTIYTVNPCDRICIKLDDIVQ